MRVSKADCNCGRTSSRVSSQRITKTWGISMKSVKLGLQEIGGKNESKWWRDSEDQVENRKSQPTNTFRWKASNHQDSEDMLRLEMQIFWNSSTTHVYSPGQFTSYLQPWSRKSTLTWPARSLQIATHMSLKCSCTQVNE